jgi:transcriptional regulator with XRE-family HTH domain
MDDTDFGHEVERQRKRRNLSVQDLIDGSGLSRMHLWRLVNGKSSPTLGAMNDIAEGLGMELEIRLVNRRRQK